jgi:hypothetical protein
MSRKGRQLIADLREAKERAEHDLARCREDRERVTLREMEPVSRREFWGGESRSTVQMTADMRIAVLAVCLMLQDRANALQTPEWGEIRRAHDEQARVDRLRALLSDVTAEDEAAALALWEEVAE